ncbi:MAG TPA: lysophospholipid acyltransferase family protein [Arenibaculum sp.]|nr:lysophospholipid acyltransferase family protein [Arenibaculum sp.]
MTPAERVGSLRSRHLVSLFGRYMCRYARRRFHAVRLSGSLPDLPEARPAIVYSNHPGWWDPAMFMVLATSCFPERRGYGPMAADALARYRFMERIGIFGIGPGTAGARRFLTVCRGLLEDPRTMLWITAEGEFRDPRVRPVRLRPGLAHLAAGSPSAMIVPLAIEYPFWTERTPEALLRFGDPVGPVDGGARSVDAWSGRLAARLEATMDALAADAVARDPQRLRTLIEGAAGVGGVYDLWRRAAAGITGRPWRAEHGGDAP